MWLILHSFWGCVSLAIGVAAIVLQLAAVIHMARERTRSPPPDD